MSARHPSTQHFVRCFGWQHLPRAKGHEDGTWYRAAARLIAGPY